ncbi:MAG: PQQ-dependent sugar dehydrogenase [Gemmatimonadetes bacterium]|nr:PQQ-dependent sugar dehydrogenase [Gemmatimonadota bacterium]
MATRRSSSLWLATCLLLLRAHGLGAQTVRGQWVGIPPVPVPDALVLHTADQPNVMMRVLARGLTHPWSLEFLPEGDFLVTERLGTMQVVRSGALTRVAGLPEVDADGQYNGLLDVELDPDFARNRTLFLTYTTADDPSTIALASARFDGTGLRDLRVVFRAAGRAIGVSSSRVVFAPDGTLYLSVGGAFNAATSGLRAQDPGDHAGKILRLRPDGSAPDDNPFVGRADHLPEIYSLGHRNVMGLAIHPTTGELWGAEHAPQGGDEVNIIRPGRNYGWPVVSFGREYSGPRISQNWGRDGMELPAVVWLPSIAPSSAMFYTGDRFPAWGGDLFVGSLMVGRIDRTGHIERVKLNDAGEEIGREAILTELRRRVRDVRQGPDGLIYALLGEEEGLLVRLEPIQ